MELLDNHQLNFVIPVPNNGSISRPHGVEFEGDRESRLARGFQCYIGNTDINTFDFIVMSMRNDPYNPIR